MIMDMINDCFPTSVRGCQVIPYVLHWGRIPRGQGTIITQS